jgi:hypothetical protein
MVKYFFFISLIFVFLACNNADTNKDKSVNDSSTSGIKKELFSRFIHRFADTILEAKISDTLMKLPFIEKSNNYIDSFSHHQHGISFMSDTAGNKISVMAGYNGPERFETYYNINIDPKTFEIKILDPLSGDFISIDEYIKKNQE